MFLKNLDIFKAHLYPKAIVDMGDQDKEDDANTIIIDKDSGNIHNNLQEVNIPSFSRPCPPRLPPQDSIAHPTDLPQARGGSRTRIHATRRNYHFLTPTCVAS